MATWGKKTIRLGFEDSLYYDYSTVSDSFCFKYIYRDEYDNLMIEQTAYIGDSQGRAMMEAMINHYIAYEDGEESFIERYVKNNRFRNKS